MLFDQLPAPNAPARHPMSPRIDLAGFAREGVLGDHRALMRLVERADRLGFDCIWFNEFHFRRDELPYPSTLLLGADILARTERLRFGTSILVLPIYHPLLLAEQLAQLDIQSAGRLDIGIGRGTDPSTFTALGLSPEDAKARYAEAIDVLIGAWTQPATSNTGRFWPFADVAVGPPPVQEPHPPIYAAAVSEESIALAVERGFPLLLSLEPNEARQLPVLKTQIARLGASAMLLRTSSLSRYVICAGTDRQAIDTLDDLTKRLNARRAALARQRGHPEPEPRDRQIMQTDYAIAGTPEACLAQMQALFASTGPQSIRCLFSANGLISNADALAGMELFASEVMPALRSTRTAQQDQLEALEP